MVKIRVKTTFVCNNILVLSSLEKAFFFPARQEHVRGASVS